MKSDEQLAATQKGLQGVAMPNFGDARNTLAKEASWEPEEPEETEDERRSFLRIAGASDNQDVIGNCLSASRRSSSFNAISEDGLLSNG